MNCPNMETLTAQPSEGVMYMEGHISDTRKPCNPTNDETLEDSSLQTVFERFQSISENGNFLSKE